MAVLRKATSRGPPRDRRRCSWPFPEGWKRCRCGSLRRQKGSCGSSIPPCHRRIVFVCASWNKRYGSLPATCSRSGRSWEHELNSPQKHAIYISHHKNCLPDWPITEDLRSTSCLRSTENRDKPMCFCRLVEPIAIDNAIGVLHA